MTKETKANILADMLAREGVFTPIFVENVGSRSEISKRLDGCRTVKDIHDFMCEYV